MNPTPYPTGTLRTAYGVSPMALIEVERLVTIYRGATRGLVSRVPTVYIGDDEDTIEVTPDEAAAILADLEHDLRLLRWWERWMGDQVRLAIAGVGPE